MREYLLKNKALLNISGIENALGMPQGYIHKYMAFGYLPEDWKPKLKKYLEKTFAAKL